MNPVSRASTSALRRSRTLRAPAHHSRRTSTSTSTRKLDVAALLSQPHEPCSPAPPALAPEETITRTQLHHLLRLSALPPPAGAAEETQLLATLGAQLAFVRQVQAVDTRGVEPLRSLRDESAAGQREAAARLEAEVFAAMAREEVRGKFHRRIRRRESESEAGARAPEWEVLGAARRKVGRFFVVEGGAEKGKEDGEG